MDPLYEIYTLLANKAKERIEKEDTLSDETYKMISLVIETFNSIHE